VQPSSFFLQVGNNLSDLASVTLARANLGLGTIATQAASGVAITGGTINGTAVGGTMPAAGAFTTLSATTPVSVASGGTGGSTASAARSGLGAAASGANTDITSISGLTTALSVGQGGTGGTTASGARMALSAAASGANTDITSLSAPALGAATATTQAAGTANSTVATTGFVATAVGGGSGSSGFPSTFATKSASYTVATSDAGTQFTLTGSSTLTLPSAASFGAGKGIFVKKTDGTGTWSIAPSSGTVDGLSAIAMYSEGSYAIVSDGTNWQSQGRPKGWIPISSVVVSSAVASINFTTGGTDPELTDMQINAENVNLGSASGFVMYLQKSGSYVTNSNSSAILYSGSGTANSTSSTSLTPFVGSNANGLFATFTTYNFRSTAQRVEMTGAVPLTPYMGTAQGQNTTAAPVTGWQLTPGGPNITAGSFFQKGFRK
jgi:hypothetical protein